MDTFLGNVKIIMEWVTTKMVTIFVPRPFCHLKYILSCNSCSIVSGNVSNCLYRLSFVPLTSSHLSSALQCFMGENHTKTIAKTESPYECSVDRQRPVENSA